MRGDRRRSVAVIVRVDRLPFGGGPLSSFVAVSVLVFFDEVLLLKLKNFFCSQSTRAVRNLKQPRLKARVRQAWVVRVLTRLPARQRGPKFIFLFHAFWNNNWVTRALQRKFFSDDKT